MVISSIAKAAGQSVRQPAILCNLEKVCFENFIEKKFLIKCPAFIGHFGDNVCAIKCEIDYERHLNLVSHPWWCLGRWRRAALWLVNSKSSLASPKWLDSLKKRKNQENEKCMKIQKVYKILKNTNFNGTYDSYFGTSGS